MDLVIGRIVKAHGVRGEVAVDVRTDEPELRFAAGSVLRGRRRDGTEERFTVTAAREHSGRLLTSFAEIPDRNAAEAARGILFLIDTAELNPSDDPDEFYDHELVGLAVENVAGEQIGTLREVLHTAGSDLLAIDVDGREVLVPFVFEMVPTIDIAARRVVIDPPDGLLDL